ncbi:PPE domain-containing protein [Nocardia coubleae]|uniref:PPE domain-containing protein n=1 Tax=Nocardia coubleae TaxID=356147 RepID=A0A846W820_9NOCA|nr:PPE domain-containing protein [Nocardia coubleae]NKX88993.1 PPE domain-containing protein [Nocardia coubleae]
MTGLSNLRAATDRVGSLFDSDISPAQSELDAQADGNKERNRIYGENQALASGFSGEYTQQVVPPVMESFTDMSHSRIMQFVESIDIGQMSTSIQGWTQLANDTTAKATAFHDNISKEMERGWAGSAATQALASTKAYLADIHKVDQAAKLIANKMDEARSGFQQVKYSVPHESDDQGDSKLGILVSVLSPATGKIIDSASAGRAEAAQAAAREVMRTVYQPVAQQSDTQVPKVPGPSKPQQDNPGNGDPGDGPGSGNTNGDNNNTGGTPGTNPANTTTEPEDPTTTEPGDEDSGDDSSSSTEEPAATTPEDTTPASTPATNPAATTPAGTTPNGLGSGGGAGAGAGAGGGSPSVPGAGSSLPGAGGATPGAGAGQKLAASAGGSAGRAGMPGMGGMGAPGARGGKDDENEHGAPDYLRGVHEELLGPDRAHVPPVIGGDA